jgi:predicted CXXCH cytochrome family protein
MANLKIMQNHRMNYSTSGNKKLLYTGVLALFMAFLSAFLFVHSAYAQENQPGTEGYCLSCHGKPDLSMTLPSGEKLSLYISEEVLHQSVHSPLGIECRACHTNITTYPHPKISFQNRRELSRSYYQACQKCHSGNYTKAQDSMHAQAAAAGNLNAPICTDCHGAHNVRPPDQPRAHISEICGQCHTQIFDQYKNSVHGAALIQQDNPDVPVCTDCHGVHNIHDPRTDQFRVETPELCAGCHANQQMMAKYSLDAQVYKLYKLSWHGVDVSLYKASWPNLWHNSAVCTDCHGIHNILSTNDPNSSVNPKNLLATCQQCHPSAGPNWTAAWTGHNEVNITRTPFLFYTQAFYDQFTPFVLWVSAIYVILQIIHATEDRIRRSIT